MKIIRKLALPAVGATALCGAAFAQSPDATSPTDGAPMTAVLSFAAADGQAVGGGMMTDTGQSVSVSAQFSNLPAGAMGVRIHETGRCAPPDFESAGDRLPAVAGGGDASAALEVGETGVAIARFEFAQATLIGDGPDVLLDGDGAAVVVHATSDDVRDAADERIACAVVQPD